MSTSLEYFRIIAPQYSALADGTVQAWLDMADLTYDAPCLDANADALAEANLAAHMLTLKDLAASGVGVGAQGPLVMEKEGDLQRSYAAPASNATKSSWDSYTLTSYGNNFLNLTAPCFAGGILTR